MIIVLDISVLINYFRIIRIDLLAYMPHSFHATDHVFEEITDHYPNQQEAFNKAKNQGVIKVVSVRKPREIELFQSLIATGVLGNGECSAIAYAINRGYSLAIDDRVAIRHAQKSHPDLSIITTEKLMVMMINSNLLSINEADQIKEEWKLKHRFHVKIGSFKELTR